MKHNKERLNSINNKASENRELMSDVLDKETRLREKFFGLIESINQTYESKFLPSVLTYGAAGAAITTSIPEVVLNGNTGIENYALLGAGVAVAVFGLKKFGKVLDKDWDEHVANADPSYRDILRDVEREFEKNSLKNRTKSKVSDFVKGLKGKQHKLGQKNA